MTNDSIMRVRIRDIIVRREINPRFELDPDYIEELKATDHWPVLVVNRDMILIDGFHRLEAAKRRGDEEIEVEVRDTEKDDPWPWQPSSIPPMERGLRLWNWLRG